MGRLFDFANISEGFRGVKSRRKDLVLRTAYRFLLGQNKNLVYIDFGGSFLNLADKRLRLAVFLRISLPGG
jgi:hypothetical protein